MLPRIPPTPRNTMPPLWPFPSDAAAIAQLFPPTITIVDAYTPLYRNHTAALVSHAHDHATLSTENHHLTTQVEAANHALNLLRLERDLLEYELSDQFSEVKAFMMHELDLSHIHNHELIAELEASRARECALLKGLEADKRELEIGRHVQQQLNTSLVELRGRAEEAAGLRRENEKLKMNLRGFLSTFRGLAGLVEQEGGMLPVLELVSEAVAVAGGDPILEKALDGNNPQVLEGCKVFGIPLV